MGWHGRKVQGLERRKMVGSDDGMRSRGLCLPTDLRHQPPEVVVVVVVCIPVKFRQRVQQPNRWKQNNMRAHID